MARHWHNIPTLIPSFGYPFYLYNAPCALRVVNANATMPSMQNAVVKCLMGRAEWNRSTTVDALCGLPDARLRCGA